MEQLRALLDMSRELMQTKGAARSLTLAGRAVTELVLVDRTLLLVRASQYSDDGAKIVLTVSADAPLLEVRSDPRIGAALHQLPDLFKPFRKVDQHPRESQPAQGSAHSEGPGMGIRLRLVLLEQAFPETIKPDPWYGVRITQSPIVSAIIAHSSASQRRRVAN